ncbi:MAG: hypothetical protein ABSA33_04070, partial [Candidatus Micrarchaeaceae archaeon]
RICKWSTPENHPVGYKQDAPRNWTQAISHRAWTKTALDDSGYQYISKRQYFDKLGAMPGEENFDDLFGPRRQNQRPEEEYSYSKPIHYLLKALSEFEANWGGEGVEAYELGIYIRQRIPNNVEVSYDTMGNDQFKTLQLQIEDTKFAACPISRLPSGSWNGISFFKTPDTYADIKEIAQIRKLRFDTPWKLTVYDDGKRTAKTSRTTTIFG